MNQRRIEPRKASHALQPAGFTLIELLVVIAIIAVLAVAAILTLNPVQLIRQSRDATRVADLATTKKALALYQFTNGSLGAANTVYVSITDSSSSCANLGLPALPAGWTYACAPSSSYRKPDGTGWIPIDLTILSTGSPIGALPIDPINTTSTNFYYTYIASSSIYKFTASLESQKQMNMMAKDGGIDPALVETGTPSIPSPRGGLVGYWRFDEGGGTTAGDSSGGGRIGTLGGGILPAWQTWTNCKVGAGCLSFNTNYVSIPGAGSLISGTNGHTMMAWFNPTVLAVNTNIFMSFGLPYISVHLASAKPFHSARIALAQQSVTGNTVVSTGNWYHIAGVYDNNNMLVYLNGALNGSLAITGADSISANLCVGAHGCASYWTNGLVDDVRIYNRALSAAEIQALYNATK